jgi:hypothetical protein
MDTQAASVHQVERVDDIPVLLATLKQQKVAEILDCHFPSGHCWKGELSFGEVACVWLAFITSQGDHRLSKGISLVKVQTAGQLTRHLTPLTDLQKKLLDLWGLAPDLYSRLTLHSPIPNTI